MLLHSWQILKKSKAPLIETSTKIRAYLTKNKNFLDFQNSADLYQYCSTEWNQGICLALNELVLLLDCAPEGYMNIYNPPVSQ